MSSESLQPKYVYGPILPIGSIRVLGLLPGKRDDAIECVLHTRTLDEVEGIYDALSYCWASELQLMSICCGGGYISVTGNLFDALQNFRHPSDTRYLWVDAICINQENPHEKGDQVKRMGKVFEKAKQVIAWIGRDDDKQAADCFALIHDTVSFLDEVYISSGQKYFPPLGLNNCPISADQQRWDGVRELLGKDWFLRAWVVQEAGIGKACVLNWGHHTIPLIDVVELMYFVEWRTDVVQFTGNVGSRSATITDCFIYIQSGFETPHSWREGRPVLSWRLNHYTCHLFSKVILCSQKLKASDSRDYVYAFLGSPMARRQDGGTIVDPDYNANRLANNVS